MKNALFTDSQFERMAGEVRRILREVGYLIDHPQVKALALRTGCRESPEGRILFTNEQIEDLRARLLKQYPKVDPPNSQSSLVHPERNLSTGFGNLTPKYFNYPRNKPETATTSIFIEVMKFVQSEPQITAVTIPLSRSEVSPEMEQIESVLLMARYTNKKFGATDATIPESVPFLAEMGQVLGWNPAEFVGCCNCINPPLRLENRTAETMLQRKRYHSRSMITTMPCLGGSGPVDIYGSIILATAEIVGGLILSYMIDPEAPLLGYTACTQVDMHYGNATSSTPQTIRVDAGVHQLMRHSFGGGTAVGGRSYVSARRPGLQAVFERFMKALGYFTLVDDPAFRFSGLGNLDNGSLLSPEQFLLDVEMVQGLDGMWTAPKIPETGDAFSRIADGVLKDNGDFLNSEHTLTHYRNEMWNPAYFQCLSDTRTEKEILDLCHARYEERVKNYESASYPNDNLLDLGKIVKKARAALLNQ